MKYCLITPKIARCTDTGYIGPTHAHWCPACAQLHHYAVDAPFSNGCQWKFNGSDTFTPSMNIRIGPRGDGSKFKTPLGEFDIEVCHYTITAGEIQFHADCTHIRRGTKVVLPDIPASAWKWSQHE